MTATIRITQFALCLVFLASLPVATAEPLAPFQIAIENKENIRLGDYVTLAVNQLGGSEHYASFQFVIAFDPNKLELQEVLKGAVPGVCHWDYFADNTPDCDGCDWELIQVQSVANYPGIPGTPLCYSDYGELFALRFKVRPDTLNAGTRADVSFYWLDCASNTAISIAEDTTWHGKFAYDHLGNDITGGHPNFGSTLSGCITPGESVPIRAINTFNGGVAISADYGVYGDVNGDGRLNIADITYMIAHIFAGGSAPKDFLRGDFDGDGNVTVGDVVTLLNYLFVVLGQS